MLRFKRRLNEGVWKEQNLFYHFHKHCLDDYPTLRDHDKFNDLMSEYGYAEYTDAKRGYKEFSEWLSEQPAEYIDEETVLKDGHIYGFVIFWERDNCYDNRNIKAMYNASKDCFDLVVYGIDDDYIVTAYRSPRYKFNRKCIRNKVRELAENTPKEEIKEQPEVEVNEAEIDN